MLVESSFYSKQAQDLASILCTRTRCLVLELVPITADNWQTLTDTLRASLAQLNIRQASFVSFGAAGSLLQNLCLYDVKLVRSAVFVDAATRAHPSSWIKLIDRLEGFLPMGLPFRSDFAGFDGRSALQRIRCPSLVISTTHADPYLREQAKLLSQAMPTSWYFDLQNETSAAELTELVLQFEQVPAKCPQKRRAAL